MGTKRIVTEGNDNLIDNLIGKGVFVRTVTCYYTGRLLAVDENFLLLSEAAWIADTGRFTNALSGGTLNEVEPYPDEVLVNRAQVVDVCEWLHDLPRAQK